MESLHGRAQPRQNARNRALPASEPALAASARQRVRELSSYHWETLKLMFVGQRNPGPDPGCVFAQLDNDALRIMAGAVADALLSTESQAVRDYDSIRALARPTSATH